MLCLSSTYCSLSVHQPHRKGKPIQKLGECVSLGVPTTKIWSQPRWTPWSCNFLNQARLWTCWNARICSSHRHVSSSEKLYPESWGWFFICFCSSPWNWPCVGNGAWWTRQQVRWWNCHGKCHGSLGASGVSSLPLVPMQWPRIEKIHSFLWLSPWWPFWTRLAQTPRTSWNQLFYGRAMSFWLWSWL